MDKNDDIGKIWGYKFKSRLCVKILIVITCLPPKFTHRMG